MNLIRFRGLNCFHNCIVNVAALLGVDYLASFANLWSETDFAYDPVLKVYLTKRMLTNLEALGARLETLRCATPKEVTESLSLFRAGEWIIAGMDAFDIPWNLYYRTLHGPHYFLACKQAGGPLSCLDPTDNKQDLRLTPEAFVPYVFDIRRIRRVPEKPLHAGLPEAREILRTHPETQKDLFEKIRGCAGENQKNTRLIAKYIDAMTNNRYLYRHYLQNSPSASGGEPCFFDSDFFLRWTAVKNGLYKAALVRNSESILQEVCSQLGSLLHAETIIAETMLAAASG